MTDTDKEGKEIMWKMFSDIKQKRSGRRAGALALAFLLAAAAPELSGTGVAGGVPAIVRASEPGQNQAGSVQPDQNQEGTVQPDQNQQGTMQPDQNQEGTVQSGQADSNRMPELEAGRVCSLKLTMTYTDPNLETDVVKPISDSEVKVAQIASLTVNGGSAEYTLLDAYKETGIELEGMNAEQSNEAAGLLLPLARGQQAANGADAGSSASETVHAETIRQGTTGADGTAFFDNLEAGMYLVFQEPGANSGSRVDDIACFLVQVPYPVRTEGGNTWQYAVDVYPKTELSGPRDNGVIRVTKQLFNIENELSYNPPENQELVFYAGLFTDEACTVRAEGTSDQPLRFLNSDQAEVVFENLRTDQTYYVSETDGEGNAVASALGADGVLFEAQYPDGQAVSITRQEPEGRLVFRNTTTGLPMGYYYGGTLTITKKTMMGQEPYDTDQVFYASLFTDAGLRDRYGEVIPLEMSGSSSVSIPLEVNIGTSASDSATYYVAETDENGTPLGSGQPFSISLNKEGGKVTLTPESPDDEVIITNTFPKDDESEPSVPGDDIQSGDHNNSGNIQKEGKSVRTGDETPIRLFAVLLALSFGAAVLLLFRKTRLKKQ